MFRWLPWVPSARASSAATDSLAARPRRRCLAFRPSAGSLSTTTTDEPASRSTPHTRRLSYSKSSQRRRRLKLSPTNSRLSHTKGSPSACPHAVSPTHKLQPRTTTTKQALTTTNPRTTLTTNSSEPRTLHSVSTHAHLYNARLRLLSPPRSRLCPPSSSFQNLLEGGVSSCFPSPPPLSGGRGRWCWHGAREIIPQKQTPTFFYP